MIHVGTVQLTGIYDVPENWLEIPSGATCPFWNVLWMVETHHRVYAFENYRFLFELKKQ